MTKATTNKVTTLIKIRKRFMAPTHSERSGCPAPPRLYNEVKYEGLPRIAQPPRRPLLHTRADG
jgi:hypothetical protein